MADVKWIKIVTDIFDDEKILLIESMPDRDAVIVIWFKLLCLAGKQNNGGVFMLNDKIPYTEEMLSTIFRRPINTVRLAVETFEHFGMIEVVDNTITIPNWEKHQSLDKIEKGREQNRKRVAAFKERQKLAMMHNAQAQEDVEPEQNEHGNASVTHYQSVTRALPDALANAKVTPIEGEGDKNENENENEKEMQTETRTRAQRSASKSQIVENSEPQYITLRDFKLVKITKEEHQQLRSLDLSATKRKHLDAYFAALTKQINQGKEYKSHFDTLRNWMMQDGAKAKAPGSTSIDYDEVSALFGEQ